MRPKMKIKLRKIDVAIEIVTLLSVIFYIVMVAYAWMKLPETIPIHFNATGEIDGYGGKSTFVILLPVILALYFGLTILNRFPHIYSYLVEINSNNAEAQYKYATRMVRILKCETVLIFTYIVLTIIKSAFAEKIGLGNLFLPAALIVVFGTLGYYIYKSLKAA